MKKHLKFFQSSRKFYLDSLNPSAFLVKIVEDIDYNPPDSDSCLHFIESYSFSTSPGMVQRYMGVNV